VPLSWRVGEETRAGDKKHGKRNDKGGYLGLSELHLSPREEKEATLQMAFVVER